RLIFHGAELKPNDTIIQAKIKHECTLHLCLRLAQQIFIDWQGKWLLCKDYRHLFHNFWSELTSKNLVRDHHESDSRYTNTIENLTVYHLKKCVAKFLLLEPNEISLSRCGLPDIILDDNMLLQNSWGCMGCDFVARICVKNNGKGKE
ncbi:MAG: ubiquitin-like protein, partial [Candidatus Paceibacterota bacterium]